MKVLSLFDGISCGRVALQRAGFPAERYVAYEIDPNAIKISQKNYPQIEHCGDVTAANFTQYEGFDLLIGGSPCQSLSIVQSKTRQHLNGKSKLFFEYVRAFEETKPKFFLFENVASMNNESREVISQLLGCEPIFIDSGWFSAQQRPRLYWTNIPVQAKDLKDSPLVLRDIMQANVPEKYFYNYPLCNVDMDKQVCATMQHKNHDIHKRVFNPAFKCHTLLCDGGGGNRQKKVYQDGRARKLTPVEYERLQTLPDEYTEGVADCHRYTAIGNAWTVDVIAWIFSFIPREGVEEWML